MKKAILITGSDGLIGSESAYFFNKLGYKLVKQIEDYYYSNFEEN